MRSNMCIISFVHILQLQIKFVQQEHTIFIFY